MFIARLNIIVPSCLNVDSAITFFMSHSAMAAIPAIKEVVVAANSRISSKGFLPWIRG